MQLYVVLYQKRHAGLPERERRLLHVQRGAVPHLRLQLLILGSFFPPGIMYSFHVHDLPQRGRALARAGFSSSETSSGIFQPGSVRSTLIINNAGIRTVLLPKQERSG